MSIENGTQDLQVIAPSALEAIERGQIDIAIATAKKYPRDISHCLKTCRELALRNQKVAQSLHYAIPRGGKRIVGESVYFARLMAYSWRNITVLSRVIGADRDHVTVQSVAHDLENNVRIALEFDRMVQVPKFFAEITEGDLEARWRDQINTTKLAAVAIALREAIFEVVPRILFDDISQDAKALAAGMGKSFTENRAAVISAFENKGVTKDQIFHTLGINGLESVSTDDLIYLQGLWTSIKEGTSTVKEIFGDSKVVVRAKVPKTGTGVETLANRGSAQPEDPRTESQREEEKPPADASTGRSQPAQKPARKKAESGHISSATLPALRELMAKSNIGESEILEYLEVTGASAASLEKVSEKHLEMLIRDWDQIARDLA